MCKWHIDVNQKISKIVLLIIGVALYEKILSVLIISTLFLSACSVNIHGDENSSIVDNNSYKSTSINSNQVYSNSSNITSSETTSSTKTYPKASEKDLPRTYVTEPTKTNEQKIYVIEKRTGFSVNDNLQVFDFYNDVPYLYSCIKCNENDIKKLIDDNLKQSKIEKIENIKEYNLKKPLYKCDFWDVDSKKLESVFKTTVSPQAFYTIIDNPEESENVKVLANGKYVKGPVTYKHTDPANMYITKDNDDYLVYISYECSVAYDYKNKGLLIEGTYGE